MLKEYDYIVGLIDDIRKTANNLDSLGRAAIIRMENLFGVMHVSREPGFPCWTHKDCQGYYNTPREAVAAACAAEGEDRHGRV